MSNLNIGISQEGVEFKLKVPFISLAQVGWLAVCAATLAVSAVLVIGEKNIGLPEVLDPEK